MTKTIEQNFIDWESTVFGFGYGTGEEHVLPALKTFLATIGGDTGRPSGYDYQKLEHALTPTVAWLLINTLCHHDVIEYGTSPRYGWLSPEGQALKDFTDGKSVEELYDLIGSTTQDTIICYPDACNCGPHGYDKDSVCPNPFWKGHHK